MEDFGLGGQPKTSQSQRHLRDLASSALSDVMPSQKSAGRPQVSNKELVL
jgi:hypothetical protein